MTSFSLRTISHTVRLPFIGVGTHVVTMTTFSTSIGVRVTTQRVCSSITVTRSRRVWQRPHSSTQVTHTTRQTGTFSVTITRSHLYVVQMISRSTTFGVITVQVVSTSVIFGVQTMTF